jgi:hypothetical protein
MHRQPETVSTVKSWRLLSVAIIELDKVNKCMASFCLKKTSIWSCTRKNGICGSSVGKVSPYPLHQSSDGIVVDGIMLNNLKILIIVRY